MYLFLASCFIFSLCISVEIFTWFFISLMASAFCLFELSNSSFYYQYFSLSFLRVSLVVLAVLIDSESFWNLEWFNFSSFWALIFWISTYLSYNSFCLSSSSFCLLSSSSFCLFFYYIIYRAFFLTFSIFFITFIFSFSNNLTLFSNFNALSSATFLAFFVSINFRFSISSYETF